MTRRRTPRFLVAILFVRATRVVMKLLRHKGTHFPGQLAKKLCPDFLMRMEKPDRIIAVTGTNGKTTVANMVADLARSFGLDFAHNAYGSNIEEGIITTLLDATTLTGKKKLPLAILEIDERLTRVVFKSIHPDYLVITNLFRESYLRNAHGEFIYKLLDDSIPKTTHLVINADDLLSQNLAATRPHTSFGIARLPGEPEITESLIRDVVLCPQCHGQLTDTFIRYHHIGRSHCESCGWKSLAPDYEITSISSTNNAEADEVVKERASSRPLPFNMILEADTLVLNTEQGEEVYPFRGENMIDLYNELAAIALFRTLGKSHDDIAKALSDIVIGRSRKQVLQIGRKRIYRMLAKGKNPIAVSRVIEAVRAIPGKKQFILLVDTSTGTVTPEDNAAWMFDADLSALNDHDVTRVVIAGRRCEDLRLALLFAGVDEQKIVARRDKRDASDALLQEEGRETIAILYELYSEPVSRIVIESLQDRLEKETDRES